MAPFLLRGLGAPCDVHHSSWQIALGPGQPVIYMEKYNSIADRFSCGQTNYRLLPYNQYLPYIQEVFDKLPFCYFSISVLVSHFFDEL